MLLDTLVNLSLGVKQFIGLAPDKNFVKNGDNIFFISESFFICLGIALFLCFKVFVYFKAWCILQEI